MKKILYILFLICCLQSGICIIYSQPTQEWAARYNSPHSVSDRFEGMVLDKNGNSYMTGWNNDSTNGNDIITVKINNAGQTVWSQVYNSGGPGSNELGQAIAVDDSGNVYVTGYTGLNFGPFYIITIKYDSVGNMKWAKINNVQSEGLAIKTDKAGNIYVVGGSGRAIVIKYNTNGDTIWTRQYLGGSYSIAYCLGIDGMGKIYIGGTMETASVSNALVSKYDSSGNSIWTNTYPVGNYSDASSIAIDSLGNGAISGAYVPFSSGFGCYYTLRFTASGNTLWQRYYNNGHYDDFANSVTIDNIGNTYVTGSSWGNSSGIDYATLKYNLQGDSVWVKRYNGPANATDQSYSVCVDSNGNCYVTGVSTGISTGDDYATIKYSPSGVQLWTVRYNGPANGGDGAASIILGRNNNIFVGGESDGIGTGKDLAVIKYDQLIGIENTTTELPNNFNLSQNYPNPFNPVTIISYDIPENSDIKLTVFNIIGEEVKILVDRKEEPGHYSVAFNLENFPSGVYFYKLTAGDFAESKKMILIK